MDPRGRARSRGRARAAPASSSAGGPGGGRPGPSAGQQQAPGAPPYARPPQPPAAAPASAWVRPPMQPQLQTVGRGSRQGGGDDGSAPSTSRADPEQKIEGGGDAGNQEGTRRGGGNGGVRGRTNRNEILHTRPKVISSKVGTTGQRIKLNANFFELLQHGKWCLNQYRVDFNPESDNTGEKKGFMRTALKDVIKGGYLFDGTVLYTPQRLTTDPLELFVANKNSENVRITIRLVGDVSWGDTHYLQLFNIIIRKCLSYMQLQIIGRNYFDPNAKISLPEYKLELWPGYYTSMRQHERSILLNADVQHKVTRMDTVYDMLIECRSGNPRNEFLSKIIGSIVLTGYNNRTYKIDDVDFNSKPTSTFPMKDGTQMSYMEYYKQKYNIRIQVDNQPMLVSRSKPREIRAGMPETIYLVPELCTLTGLTDHQRDNVQLMRGLAEHTRVGPEHRMRKLMDFIRRMHQSKEAIQEIRRWDLNLADKLVEFDGRVLPEEKIVLGNNAQFGSGQKADWTMHLRSNLMYSSEPLKGMVVLTPKKFFSQTQSFVDTLKRCARGMKWDIINPQIFDIHDDRANSYLDALENIISSERPSLVMCVVPNQTADRYSAIKKKCIVDRGCPSQVLCARNLTSPKGVMSIATKVAIQINCKVGGAPWTVVMPLSALMIVGYDVCRDTANRGRSFGAMVASMDRYATRYFNHVTEHRMEEELSDNFAAFMVLACQKYKNINGKFPERIIIYRDGVGDGQLPYVYEHEVVNIKKRLTAEIYPNNDLRMAFVVVSKRINTRIFSRNNNPPPGTVVDDVITLPERYDFFIVSQCVRQGTVAPTSYNVIEDTMGLPPDRMQILTYKLTHMYYNWSGTVRVPAPCQYAHKLAFLVSQHLHRPAHRNLESVLYYL